MALVLACVSVALAPPPRAGTPKAVAINKVDFCYGLPVRAHKEPARI